MLPFPRTPQHIRSSPVPGSQGNQFEIYHAVPPFPPGAEAPAKMAHAYKSPYSPISSTYAQQSSNNYCLERLKWLVRPDEMHASTGRRSVRDENRVGRSDGGVPVVLPGWTVLPTQDDDDEEEEDDVPSRKRKFEGEVPRLGMKKPKLPTRMGLKIGSKQSVTPSLRTMLYSAELEPADAQAKHNPTRIQGLQGISPMSRKKRNPLWATYRRNRGTEMVEILLDDQQGIIEDSSDPCPWTKFVRVCIPSDDSPTLTGIPSPPLPSILDVKRPVLRYDPAQTCAVQHHIRKYLSKIKYTDHNTSNS